MTELMETLYVYAEEKMVYPSLKQDPEYTALRLSVCEKEQALLDLLGSAAQKSLENFIEEYNYFSSLYDRAMFCAGFQIARELIQGDAMP